MPASIPLYVPQSPTPHSPPRTPSPDDLDHSTQTLTVKRTSTVTLDTPLTTPDEAYPTSIPQVQIRRPSSVVSGMGISFPEQNNPLPAELGGDGSESGIEMARSLSEEKSRPTVAAPAMAQSRSTGAQPPVSIDQNDILSIPPAGTSSRRSHSPTGLNLKQHGDINAFSSSSSYHGGSPGQQHRERIVSPTSPRFDIGNSEPQLSGLNTNTNGLIAQSQDEKSPLYSPAIDGKKEPSIKPPPFDFDQFSPAGTKNRSRSPYPGGPHSGGNIEYQPHPLTSQVYNHPTRDGPAKAGGFYDSAAWWLGMYFFFNLGLTLFNKTVLVGFPFPYTLTGLHALSGCAGTYFALERGAFVPARLTQKENFILGAFSVLYTINIAVSNISLQLVTIPFHQVVRASTPLFTILISTVILRTKFSMIKLVSLLPVVAGVGFATYGDYYFTAWGLILTLLGTFLAALKTVMTNLMQTGAGQRLKLHPLDLLMRMSPLAFIQCVIYGWYTGELDRVRRYGATQMTRGKAVALLINGVIACGLNIVSFTANKKAGALTMTVSANCKQVLTIALAVVLFDVNISPTNGIGIMLTLIGGAWYGYVEFQEKRKKSVKLVDRS